MLTGASDPETAVPACIEELKTAGLDKVIEEAQRQIDEFFEINSIRLYKSDNAQHDRLSRHKIRRAYYI